MTACGGGRSEQNPIYDDHWAEDMCIVERDDKLYMFAEGLNDQAHLLTSQDGLAWERIGELDVRLTDGGPIEPGPYGTPAVYVDDAGLWHLFYERRDQGVWLATSRDLRVWTNVSDAPVLSPGPESYDKAAIALNQIVPYAGRYYAYYHGSPGEGRTWQWCTCVAVSDDLRQWTKYPENPLLPLANNQSSGVLIHDGDRFRLYTMHAQVEVHFGPRCASPSNFVEE